MSGRLFPEQPGHPNLAASLAKIDAADHAFFARFPKRQHRIRITGRAEVENHFLRKCAPGTQWFTLVRRTPKRGRKFRLLFNFVAADPRLDTDVSEDIAAGAYARASGLTRL